MSFSLTVCHRYSEAIEANSVEKLHRLLQEEKHKLRSVGLDGPLARMVE